MVIPPFIRGVINGGITVLNYEKILLIKTIIFREHYLSTKDTAKYHEIRSDGEIATWTDKKTDKHADLLFAMGQSLGYKFERTYIKRSMYYPQGYINIETDNSLIREGIIAILQGRQQIQVNITNDQSINDK